MNEEAASVDPGSDGIVVLPFGNGAERMLNNKNIGAQVSGLDLNKHRARHLYRATQEGIACAFRYGVDIMKENGITPHLIRVGKTNMFQSSVFTGSFVNTLNVPVELYETDGSIGAAIGAGIGAGIYKNSEEAFHNQKPVQLVKPEKIKLYDDFYNKWLTQLNKQLNG
jgi:xylulokinase